MSLRTVAWVPDRFTGRETEWERLEYGFDRTLDLNSSRWEVIMLPQNDYLIQRDLDYRLEGIQVDARQRRLLRSAGIARRNWLTCQVCRSLWRLGRLLITTGLRLERRYAPMGLSHA